MAEPETRLRVDDVVVRYERPVGWGRPAQRTVTAVDHVSLTVAARETLAVVGESGSGKTSLARAILGRVQPRAGDVVVDGQSLLTMTRAQRRAKRRDVSFILQDPFDALNPRMTIRQVVAEPLRVHAPDLSNEEVNGRVDDMLRRVGLSPDVAERRPRSFSGGQRQRMAIARAFIGRPSLVVADEPTSALDVSIQAQVLELLAEMRDEHDVALLFISHDLALVRYVADRVAVMYAGQVVETGATEAVFARPQHPYTQALLDAVPRLEPWDESGGPPDRLDGEPPDLASLPTGCSFHPRCPIAVDMCTEQRPILEVKRPDQLAACWLAGDVSRGSLDTASRPTTGEHSTN